MDIFKNEHICPDCSDNFRTCPICNNLNVYDGSFCYYCETDIPFENDYLAIEKNGNHHSIFLKKTGEMIDLNDELNPKKIFEMLLNDLDLNHLGKLWCYSALEYFFNLKIKL